MEENENKRPSPAVAASGPEEEMKMAEVEDAIKSAEAATGAGGGAQCAPLQKKAQTGAGNAQTGAETAAGIILPEGLVKAPAVILAGNRVGGPCEGMRRIRSDGELPAEVLEYIELVEGNRPRACKEQHALAALIRRLANEEGWWFDEARFRKYLGLQKYWPFELFPWQKFQLALWLCSFEDEGFPRWDTLFDMIARGAGKDGEIAYSAMALTSPYNPVPDYDVDICANDEVQAVRPMKDLIRVLERPKQAAKLNRFFHHTKETVDGIANGGAVHGWANKAANRDGLRSGLIVFNEVHQYQNYDNISVFTSGLGKKKEPRTGVFTSNGKINDGPLDDWLNQGMRILFEGEADHGMLPFICRLEREEQVHEPSNWSMANPSWAYLPNLRRETEKEYRGWLTNPERHGDFLPKRMGIRKGFQELAVTDYEKILATKQPLPLDRMKGAACVAGLDYAEMNDWAAMALLFRLGDVRAVLAHTWICEQSKTLPRVRAPWQDWVSAGHCTLVHEPTISPELLADWLRRMGQIYRIRMLAMDNFRWTLVADAMIRAGWDAKDRKKVKLVRPSDIMKVEPLIAANFDMGRYVWGDNPPLRWATNNTKRIPRSRSAGSDTGNFYYGKIEAKSRKTDTFMALVAAETCEEAIPRGGAVIPDSLPVFVLG